MKVLIYTQHFSSSTGGGIGHYCRSLVDLFKVCDDILVSLSDLHPIKDNKLLGVKLPVDLLCEELDEKKPDVVHINGYTSRIIGQVVREAKKRKIKIVYSPHWHPFRTMNRSCLKQLYFKLFIKPNLKDINIITTINTQDTAFFKKYHSNVIRIPHWLPKSMMGQFENVKKISNRLLFVGRTQDLNKGFNHILNLPLGVYDIHVVGCPVNTDRLDITFHTNIPNDELQQLYSTSALLIVPSKYEAFSYVCLEALLYKTPLLLTEGVRIIDYLPNNTYTIFKHGDFNDFINKVEIARNNKIIDLDFMIPFTQSRAYAVYRMLYKSLE